MTRRAMRIVFMGTPEFACPALEALISSGNAPLATVTQPDRRAGRGRGLTAPPVKKLAGKHGIPVLQPDTLKDEALQDRLRSLDPEFIVVAAYGKILPPAVLEIPSSECLNVHASLLPRHRGASPIAHAIWEGDAETGVCIMRMEKGLDTGPVFLSDGIPIPADATTGSLEKTLAARGAEALLRALEAIREGRCSPQAQDDALATLAPRLKKEHGRLDFREPAERLERQVRAMDPWPGAFFAWSGEGVKVHRAAVGPAAPSGAAPGGVLPGAPLRVACGGGGSLLLEVIQRQGKRPMPSEEVLRGFSIGPGDQIPLPEEDAPKQGR